MKTSTQLLLNKQPILNADTSLYGYQLSVDFLEREASCEIDIALQLNSLYQDIDSAGGLGLITQNKPIFFRIDRHFLGKSYLPNTDDINTFVVEVDNSILGDKDALTNLKALASEGISIAVNITDLSKDTRLLSCAHYIKISAQQFDPETLSSLLPEFSDKKIILTDVDSDETLARYSEFEITLYQGFFYTDPIINAEHEPDNNKLVLLKLLAEVNNPDIEFHDIVQTIQMDALLSHKLIAAINHPQNNLPTYVDNLKDAVNFMGLKRLKFWTNLLVLSQIGDVPKELLVTALVRAKFLEMLAHTSGKSDQQDRFFMVGLFSTLNAFLKIPMSDIIGRLAITEEIKNALIDQSSSMGKALFIVKSLEQGNTQIISLGYDGLGLMEVSSNYMKANGWAYQTLATLS